MTATELRTLAPRLCRAWEQNHARELADASARRVAAHQALRAERLVAHRELQLARAYATGDGRYIDRRRSKLEQAKRRLSYWRGRS